MSGKDMSCNLDPVRTSEEAKKRGRAGGIASGEARRAKKNMRETAKALLEMKVVGDANSAVLIIEQQKGGRVVGTED